MSFAGSRRCRTRDAAAGGWGQWNTIAPPWRRDVGSRVHVVQRSRAQHARLRSAPIWSSCSSGGVPGMDDAAAGSNDNFTEGVPENAPTET